jgi:hypothetical protein
VLQEDSRLQDGYEKKEVVADGAFEWLGARSEVRRNPVSG